MTLPKLDSMTKENFKPSAPWKQFGQDEFTLRYEGDKGRVVGDLMGVESCWTKCNFSVSNGALSQDETDCLRRCVSKYNDLGNLLNSEVVNYSRSWKI
jgi:hypothetical protein